MQPSCMDRQMEIVFEKVLPKEIEKRSFEIITEELGNEKIDAAYAPIIKRVIHTTADFEYARSLVFSDRVLETALRALKNNPCIVTDTKMVKSGINNKALTRINGEIYNFISDEEVAREAHERNMTRAAVCMEKAAQLNRPVIFAIGNAPTALIRLHELYQAKRLRPELVIGVPVGFVNVIPAKELILASDIPHIVARGRKGGSNVAAAIVNALLYLSEAVSRPIDKSDS